MQNQIRVPVLDINGNPTMPTKASRARRWLRDGKAKVVHNDLGVFQIQLLQEASGAEQQDIVVGIDQGKLYTGMAVQSAKSTLLMLHLELPFLTVKKRVEQRTMMRRTRRGRRINRKVNFKFRNHRQERFNNRKHKEILPPSINANKQLEKRVVKELLKIFPMTNCVFELVKARGSKGFSPVMCGQKLQVKYLETLLPTETIFGWKTSILRDKLGLVKNKTSKSTQEPATHAIDGVALACHHFIKYVEDVVHQCADWFGEVEVTKSQFVIIGRPKHSRRQLHYLQISKERVLKKYGSSYLDGYFRKGDFVNYTKKGKSLFGYCAGFCNKALTIVDVNWKIIGKFSPKKCKIIFRNNGLVTQAQ